MATISAVVRWADNTADLARNLKEGLNQIEATRASVEKLVQSLNGEKLVAAAHRSVAAIREVGGAAKLTGDEATRHLSLIDRAMEKLALTGKPIPDAMRSMRDELAGIAKEAPALESLGTRITGIAAAAASAKVAIQGFVSVVREWITASSEQEDSMVRLDTALRAQGTFAPELVRQYAALAEQFQRTTAFSDELVMEMEALLVQVGNVLPHQMEAALQASADLAAGLRIDLRTATMLVGKAFEGETGTLKRYGIVIDEVALKTRGAEAVIEAIATKMGGQAAAQAQTFSGQLARLTNAINDTEESLGGLLAKGLTPIIDAFLTLPEPVQNGVVGLGLLTTAAAALSVALAGVGAAVTLALPLLGLSPAAVGATVMGTLATAAAGAATAFLSLAAAITAVWAAWKIGNTETVKNAVAIWALSSDNLTARLYRAVLGFDQMTEAQARSAVAATVAGQEQAKLAAVFANMPTPMASHTTADPSLITGEWSVQQLEQQAEARKRQAEAIKRAAEEQRRWNERVREASGPAKGFEFQLALLKFQMGQMADATLKADQRALGLLGTLEDFTRVQIPELPSRQIGTGLGFGPAVLPTKTFDDATDRAVVLNRTISTLARGFEMLAQVGGEALSRLARDIGRVITAMEVGQRAGQGFRDSLTQIRAGERAEGFANMAGNIMGMVGAMDAATSSGSRLQNVLGGAATGASIGMQLGGPIGAAIGGGIGGLIGLLRGTEESRLVSPQRDIFFQMQGGLERLNPLVQQLTGNLRLVQAVFDARTVKEYEAAVQNLMSLFEDQKTAFAELDAAAQRYGFTLEELGPALQRQELDKQAQQLFKDWQLLNSAGIETVTVATRMAESINAYVQNAVKMGIEVPEAMRPMLQQMVDMGLLTDTAGNKITNLEDAGVSFTMTMSEGFKQLIDQVKKLTDLIARSLGLAIENIPDPDVTVHVDYDIEDLPKIPQEFPSGITSPDDIARSFPDAYGFRGGLVTEEGIRRFATGGRVLNFVPRGIDTQPAMLAVGEGVVNRTGMQTLGDAGLESLNSGRQPSGSGTVVTFEAGAIQVNGALIHEHDLEEVVTNAALKGIEKGGRKFGRFSKLVRQAS